MHSVTSNAVNLALNTVSTTFIPFTNYHYDGINLYKVGKVVFMSIQSDWYSLQAGYTYYISTIPQGYRPKQIVRINECSLIPVMLQIGTDGHVFCYNYSSAITSATNGMYNTCWITD